MAANLNTNTAVTLTTFTNSEVPKQLIAFNLGGIPGIDGLVPCVFLHRRLGPQ